MHVIRYKYINIDNKIFIYEQRFHLKTNRKYTVLEMFMERKTNLFD